MPLDLGRKDTICALATPPGQGALGVIRVSGPKSREIGGLIFSPRRGAQRDFVATLGDLHVPSPGGGDPLHLDEGICTFFPHGKSYTGEDSFELSLHGGPVILKKALAGLVDLGCRMAQPGEFTLRAVLTGRLDLTQAEAVGDLIAAPSEAARAAALRNLAGSLSLPLEEIRQRLVDALAEMEARLDFPDEPIGEAARKELEKSLGRAEADLKALLASAEFGRRLMEGARIALFGAPNAGKSTLLNRLAGEDRALTHHVPGTTRDSLEVALEVGGYGLVLVDLAGFREATDADPVEAMGMERARRELKRAHVVVHLVEPGAQPPEKNAELADLEAEIIVVRSKSDTVSEDARRDGLWVSAKTGAGLPDFLDLLKERLGLNHASPETILTRHRQQEHVQLAARAVHSARQALDAGLADEVVCSELRVAGAQLDALLGKDVGEDVLNTIFSRFCIGK
jgi:tRNA modification GTPase